MADEMPPTKGVVLQDQPVLDAGESQAQSTQESLLEPLDESQASHMEGLVSDSDVQYLDKVTQSAVIAPPATYITRPAIETPEEMMSEFQYSKPPPRTNTKDRGGKGTQQAKTPLPAISKPPESSKQNMSPVKQLSEEDSMNSSTSSKSLPMLPAQEDHGAKSPQMTSGPLPSIPIAGSTRPSNSIMRDPEVQEVSSTSPQKAGSSPYPFKDQIDPPKSSKSHQVAKSPLSKPRYPKSIMNARERARIQMASQSRLSTPKATSTHALDSADPSSSRHTLSKSRPVVKDLKISRSHTHYPDTRTASQHPASQDNHRTMARQRNGWDHRGHELARPLLADQPHSRPYSSVSQESNISKRRTRYQSHIDQVPISSAWEASDKYFEKFAKPWNGYVLHTQQVKKWSIAEISHLNKLAEEQQAKIELYSQELAERDQAIADLTEEKGKVVQEYQQLENKYTDSSSRLTKLKEDMRTYRGRLNDATSEQQRLLAHCRDKCQRTIAEIRTKEQEQSMTVQNALEAAELARTTIQQKVLAVKEASRKQAAETEKTVGSLQAQLAERENEMATEKKQTEDLREQLAESRRLNETVLQSILSQNTDILEKVNRPPEVPIDMQLSLDEQDRKIDAIMEALEAVKAAAPDAADMMNEFKAIQDDSAKGILEVVRDEMSNRMSPHEEIEIMSHSIAAVQEMCEEIYEYVQNDETIAFWQEKSQEAIATADGRLEQIQGLRDDLNNAQTILNQQIDTNRHLQQEAQKVHDLRAQVSQLQQTVNDREATTAVSDESLKKAQQELSTQARKLEIFEETLENERQKHAQAIEKRNREHEHALEKAVVTATVRLRDEQQQMKTRLQELDQDRSRLEQELRDLQQADRSADDQIRQTGEKLKEVLREATAMTTRIPEIERKQNSLREGVKKWKEGRKYFAEYKMAVEKLQQDQPNAKKISDQLGELLETQRSLSEVDQYCKNEMHRARAAAGYDELYPHTEKDPSDGAPADQQRRVVVKSPGNDVYDVNSPISIEQEKNARRQGAAPRGIIKMVARSLSGSLSMPQLSEHASRPASGNVPTARVANRGQKGTPVTHSTYNRPVLGTIPEVNDGKLGLQQNSTVRKRDRDSRTRDTAEDSRRRRSEEFEDDEDGDEPSAKRRRDHAVDEEQVAQQSARRPRNMSRSKSALR